MSEGETRKTEFTREELYDLVWAEPMQTLAARWGISDVALKKRCVRMRIPTPHRGYWAKKAVGKVLRRPVLPKLPASVHPSDLTAVFTVYTRRFRGPSFGRTLGPLVGDLSSSDESSTTLSRSVIASSEFNASALDKRTKSNTSKWRVPRSISLIHGWPRFTSFANSPVVSSAKTRISRS